MDVALFFFNSSLGFGNHFFFSSHFRQWHCHNCHNFFSLPYFGNGIATIGFLWAPNKHQHTSSTSHPLSQHVWVTGILVMWLPKFKIFSLPLFLFFSHTFVRISATPLPKFILFLQFSKWLVTVPINKLQIQPYSAKRLKILSFYLHVYETNSILHGFSNMIFLLFVLIFLYV